MNTATVDDAQSSRGLQSQMMVVITSKLPIQETFDTYDQDQWHLELFVGPAKREFEPII